MSKKKEKPGTTSSRQTPGVPSAPSLQAAAKKKKKKKKLPRGIFSRPSSIPSLKPGEDTVSRWLRQVVKLLF